MANGLCWAQVTWCQAISQTLQLQAAWASSVLPKPALEQSMTPQVACLVRAGLRSCLAIPEGFLEEGGFQAGEQGILPQGRPWALLPAGRTWQGAPGSGLLSHAAPSQAALCQAGCARAWRPGLVIAGK